MAEHRKNDTPVHDRNELFFGHLGAKASTPDSAKNLLSFPAVRPTVGDHSKGYGLFRKPGLGFSGRKMRDDA